MGSIVCWTPPPFDRMTIEDYNQLVHMRRFDVQPPSRVYVTVDDVLELAIFAPITATQVNLSVRLLSPDGRLDGRFETYTLSTVGATPALQELRNAEGFLLSATVETPGAPRGQCFVSLRLKRGLGTGDATYGDLILQGYPGSAGSIGYPQMQPYSPLEGRGRMRVITVPNPAVGAEWSLTVPAGVNWFVLGITALFTTSAAVATREPAFVFTDGAAHIVGLTSAFTITASVSFTLVANVGVIPFSQSTIFGNPQVPFDLRLLAGWTVGSNTNLIDVADQWSAIVVTVEEFIAG